MSDIGMYIMFHAICKFTQFRNCTAQIRNCKPISKGGFDFEIEILVQTKERPRVLMTSTGDTNIDYQRQRFEAFCKEHCANRNNETISKDKGQKIMRLLKNNLVAVNYSSPFKFWVKKRAFQLTSYSTLGLKDVPCLLASVAPPYLCPRLLHNFKNVQKWLRNFKIGLQFHNF